MFVRIYTRFDVVIDVLLKFLHCLLCKQSTGRSHSFVVILHYSKHSVSVEMDTTHQSEYGEEDGDADSVTCGKGIILSSINRRPTKDISTTQQERIPKCEVHGYFDVITRTSEVTHVQ